MKTFFEAIQTLFVDYIFAPLDLLRFTHNWWLTNLFNFVLMAVGLAAIIYWLRQLKIFDDNNEEDKSSTAHTYL